MSDTFDKLHTVIRRGRANDALRMLFDKTGRKIRKPYTDDLNHAWYLVGDILYDKRDYQKAVMAFKKSTRSRPEDYQALWATAECYSEMKRPRIAVRYWEKAISIAGAKDELVFNLGNAFFDLSEFKKAISCYDKVAKRSKVIHKMAENNKLRARKMLAARS